MPKNSKMKYPKIAKISKIIRAKITLFLMIALRSSGVYWKVSPLKIGMMPIGSTIENIVAKAAMKSSIAILVSMIWRVFNEW